MCPPGYHHNGFMATSCTCEYEVLGRTNHVTHFYCYSKFYLSNRQTVINYTSLKSVTVIQYVLFNLDIFEPPRKVIDLGSIYFINLNFLSNIDLKALHQVILMIFFLFSYSCLFFLFLWRGVDVLKDQNNSELKVLRDDILFIPLQSQVQQVFNFDKYL